HQGRGACAARRDGRPRRARRTAHRGSSSPGGLTRAESRPRMSSAARGGSRASLLESCGVRTARRSGTTRGAPTVQLPFSYQVTKYDPATRTRDADGVVRWAERPDDGSIEAAYLAAIAAFAGELGVERLTIRDPELR